MQLEDLRAALRQHRLSRNLSYEDLAADLARALGEERRLSLYTLRQFVEGGTQPQETTLYTITEYLKAQGLAA